MFWENKKKLKFHPFPPFLWGTNEETKTKKTNRTHTHKQNKIEMLRIFFFSPSSSFFFLVCWDSLTKKKTTIIIYLGAYYFLGEKKTSPPGCCEFVFFYWWCILFSEKVGVWVIKLIIKKSETFEAAGYKIAESNKLHRNKVMAIPEGGVIDSTVNIYIYKLILL